jgi:hypothetical protein
LTIFGLTAPAKGAAPDSAIDDNIQYTGAVEWVSDNANSISQPLTFAIGGTYTARITLTPKDGYTLRGVRADSFNVDGAPVGTAVTNPVNSGEITVTFPILTEAITGRELTEVTAPLIGAEPVSEITGTDQYTGTIEWQDGNKSPLGGAPFSANKSYTAIITLTPKNDGYLLDRIRNDSFTVPGAYTNPIIEETKIIVTAVFPVLADNPATLEYAIFAAKVSANRVVQLTSDFYTKANNAGNFIIVDPGTVNLDPYTIKGTGANSSDVLNVGILLANNYVTLEDVKIDLTTSGNAASSTPQAVYSTGISIGRGDSGQLWFTESGLTSRHVTVKNCDVTVTGDNGATAGIYICGDASTDVYAPTDITLTGNTVKATGYNTEPVQALFIDIWHPSIEITGNTFEAQYGTRGSAPYYNSPASAIYIYGVFGAGTINNDDTPLDISGNTLISSVYSFYFNAFEVAQVTDNTGVAVLRTDSFGVAETKWALTDSSDNNSTYKKLFNALKANISGKGFAYVGVPLDSKTAIEQYEINNGEVTAISVYSDHIGSDAYDGDSEPNEFDGTGTVGYDYGRKLANSDGSADYTDPGIEGGNNFCYGLDDNGNYVYDTDLVP